jgi:hypothetical protein
MREIGRELLPRRRIVGQGCDEVSLVLEVM